MSITVLFTILEIIGTIAFTISGVLIAIDKKMDILGMIILGLVTSFGGGILRDLLIGITPPSAFLKPYYFLISMIVSCLTFLVFQLHIKFSHRLLLFVMDSIGLGIFTAIGINVAFKMGYDSFFIASFLGIITAVGGGVIRDVLAGSKPYIFVKHFYACASIIGSIIGFLVYKYINSTLAIILTVIIVFTLRVIAAHFHWNLPKIKRKSI